MTEKTKKLQDAIVAQVHSPQSGIGPKAARIGVTGVLTKFMDIIKNLGSTIDLSSMTKEEFLAAVDAAFATAIAPLLATAGPLIVMGAKMLVHAMASRFYDRHSKPKPA